MAVAFSSVDTLLSPFVKIDNLSYEEVKQSMQNYIFSINSNSRMGAEPAFSNITMDITPPRDLIDEPCIIGKNTADFTYKDCQKEMDMINKAFAELMIKGDSASKPFSYPIPTFNIHKNFDWDNENNDLLWEMAGKYGYPYFANFLNSDMEPEDARSMAILGNEEVICRRNGIIRKNEISNMVKAWNSKKKSTEPEYEMLMNGKFVPVIDMFEVDYKDTDKYIQFSMSNGLKQNFSLDHKCPIIRDGERMDVLSQDVIIGDKFLIARHAMPGPEIGTYELGRIIGYYLAEGWVCHNGTELNFAINIERNDIVDNIVSFFSKNGSRVRVQKQEEKNIFKVFVYGTGAVGLVRQYISGKSANLKRLNSNFLNTSVEFRSGIYDGYLDTDGSEKNKIFAHTTNKELCTDLQRLAASVGKYLVYQTNSNNTRYFKEDKSDLEKFTSYKLYLREAESYNEDFNLVEITDSTQIDASKINTVYNFTVDTPEHLYQLPSGLITHQCCRLRLDLTELQKRNGGLFGSGDSTGSIGVVTLNLPRIAYISRGDDQTFFKNLDEMLIIAKESLEIKRKWLQENVIDGNLIPAFNEYVGSIRNYFSTIGIVGMNEMCENFFGKDIDITTDIGRDFSISVGKYIRSKLIEFQKETGNLYNFEATPAESTAFRLAQKDIEEFPDIVTRGTKEAPYYTNSCHIPVNKIKGIKETFDHQEDLQILFTGGTVIHIYLDSAISKEAAKDIIRTVCENYKVPYVSLSPLNRYCDNHGYIADSVDNCPSCGERLKKYQRITGYLRCVDYYNDGKAEEFKERKQLNLKNL